MIGKLSGSFMLKENKKSNLCHLFWAILTKYILLKVLIQLTFKMTVITTWKPTVQS